MEETLHCIDPVYEGMGRSGGLKELMHANMHPDCMLPFSMPHQSKGPSPLPLPMKKTSGSVGSLLFCILNKNWKRSIYGCHLRKEFPFE